MAEQRKPGPRGNAAEQATRVLAMLALKAQGKTDKEVAEQFDMSEKSANEAMRKARDAGLLVASQEPREIVDNLLAQLHLSNMALTAMAHQYVDVNPTAAVGAMGKAVDAALKHAELLQVTGMLPDDLGVIGVRADQEQLTASVLGVLHEVQDQLKGLQGKSATRVRKALIDAETKLTNVLQLEEGDGEVVDGEVVDE